MRKYNSVLITTLIVSAMLMAPLAFGLSTVSINGNLVQFVEDTAGGITFDDDEDNEMVIVPDTVNGNPAYRIGHEDGANNLLPEGGGTVDFEISVPAGVYFIIFVKIYKPTRGAFELDMDIFINEEEEPYKLEFQVGKGVVRNFSQYYSSNNLVPNTRTMDPIAAKDLKSQHYMQCNKEKAVLSIEATGISGPLNDNRIEFFIVYPQA